mmetsp:Transcript_16748/g.30926  ORF Transcript_16748/g.30926 Transcript_16748/m.30926 type:complete len:489 (+) Transcript_16748:64-1530(+)
MNPFVHVIFQSICLGISALHTLPTTSTGSARFAERSSSAVVLNPAGEAALALTGKDSPMSYSRSSGHVELSESGERGSSAVVLDSAGEAALVVAGKAPLPASSNASRHAELPAAIERHHGTVDGEKDVRALLTLTQLLDTGKKSSLRTLGWLAAGSSSLITGSGLLVLLCCFLPAVIILLAMTYPYWKEVREGSPVAEAALLARQRTSSAEAWSGLAWLRPSERAYHKAVQAGEGTKPVDHYSGEASWFDAPGRLFGSFVASFRSLEPAYSSPIYSQWESDILCPEMVVQDARGTQLMLEGFFAPYPQTEVAELFSLSNYVPGAHLLRLHVSEHGADPGIALESDKIPVCFLGTSHAPNTPGKHALERYVSVVPSMPRFHRSTPPFAIVQARSERGRNFEMKKYDTGQVLLNIFCTYPENLGIRSRDDPNRGICDTANMTDPSGRLVASMTQRTKNKSVNKNKSVISIAQGADAVLVVCALIAAFKLQ